MRTLLNRFSEAFGSAIERLFPSLDQASTALAESGEALSARSLLPELRALADQFRTLAAKVADQRAYVLIFGPLKSGKSTLMNAISADYVSEVTALPAYPCLVQISHSPTRELQLTRYDGSVEAMPDLPAMRRELHRAHVDLAERLRAAEARGEDFDPMLHSPRAVRLVEVKLPSPELQSSGTILVDTPGLYTRMRFGYDRMTRDFRDTAACAIFVVRTDNLFLEQVFDEFHQLLDLFSRVFLLVNLDTTKRDLQADGSLTPSLEHEDPGRILAAFEDLAMSASLKTALGEGRLRIHAVDLLRAASQRLRQRGASSSSDLDFEGFRADLTDYLNSSDYLAAFVRDSLRRTDSLTRELANLCSSEPVRALEARAAVLQREQAVVRQKLETLKRLEGFSWEEAFRPVRQELARAVAEPSQAIRDKALLALAGVLEAWYRHDSSLQDLADRDLSPLLVSGQNELALALHRILGQRVAAGGAGPELPSGIRVALTAAGLSLDRIGRETFDAVDPYAGIESLPLRPPSARIPVRKSFWDWIFFRSREAVAKRVFGPPEQPKRRLTQAVKSKRLGPPARQALRTAVEEAFQGSFPRQAERLLDRIFLDYSRPAIRAIQEGLAEIERSCRERAARIEQELAEIERVNDALGTLERDLAALRAQLPALRARFTAPEDLPPAASVAKTGVEAPAGSPELPSAFVG